MNSRFFFFFFLIIIFYSCSTDKKKIENNTSDLLPVNLSEDRMAALVRADSTTPGKWKIRYYQKADSTKDHDLYIGCSKDTVNEIWCCKDILPGNENLPVFSQETPDAIYFNFGDTLNGPDILVFSKKSKEKFREYRNVISSNYEQGVIIFLSEKCLSKEKPFELYLADIPKMKRHRIPYKFYADSLNLASALDSVIYQADEVSIMTTLYDDNKKIRQTRVITR